MSGRPRIQAVILDCDGVLADSENLHAAATKLELRDRGIRVPDEFFIESVGMRVTDQMAMLAESYNIDRTSLMEAREHRFWALAVDHLREVPGSVDTVRELHAAGLRIAVATSGSRRWIDYVIAQFDLGTEITAAISAEDVDRPKPDPQPYLLAADALGFPAQECGAVEDSSRGARSAVAAGCAVVALNRDGLPPRQFAGAIAIATSWSQVRQILLGAAVLPLSYPERSGSTSS